MGTVERQCMMARMCLKIFNNQALCCSRAVKIAGAGGTRLGLHMPTSSQALGSMSNSSTSIAGIP